MTEHCVWARSLDGTTVDTDCTGTSVVEITLARPCGHSPTASTRALPTCLDHAVKFADPDHAFTTTPSPTCGTPNAVTIDWPTLPAGVDWKKADR